MNSKKSKKILQLAIVVTFILIIGGFYYFNLSQYLNLEFLKNRQESFKASYALNPLPWLTGYFFLYTVTAAASLPGAALLTLAGGALFGLWTGLLIVSFASTIGATLAFLSARFLFQSAVQHKFRDKLAAINKGVFEDGNFYLLSLRLVPAFPFFIINLVMGLTPIRTLNFYIISQLGMLPGTAVFVNAGTQLAKIESLKGILNLELIISFAILGTFPLVVKKIVQYIKLRKH